MTYYIDYSPSELVGAIYRLGRRTGDEHDAEVIAAALARNGCPAAGSTDRLTSLAEDFDRRYREADAEAKDAPSEKVQHREEGIALAFSAAAGDLYTAIGKERGCPRRASNSGESR